MSTSALLSWNAGGPDVCQSSSNQWLNVISATANLRSIYEAVEMFEWMKRNSRYLAVKKKDYRKKEDNITSFQESHWDLVALLDVQKPLLLRRYIWWRAASARDRNLNDADLRWSCHHLRYFKFKNWSWLQRKNYTSNVGNPSILFGDFLPPVNIVDFGVYSIGFTTSIHIDLPIDHSPPSLCKPKAWVVIASRKPALFINHHVFHPVLPYICYPLVS